MTALTTVNATLPAHLIATAEKAQDYAGKASAENTKRAYETAWADFVAWCAEKDCPALPTPEAVIGLYLADRAETLKVSTLRLRLVAISVMHKNHGHSLNTAAPQIRRVLQGITRTHGTAPRKVEAATIDVIRDTVRALAKKDGPKALRDRALLLIGFTAALRRSEISAIDLDHIRFCPEGAVLTLPRRKTDQEGQGTEIGLPFAKDAQYCPIRTLQAWIAEAGITEGAVFLSIEKGGRILSSRLGDRDIARTIKSAVAVAGYEADQFGGHSLRSGFATTAGRAGIAERIIMLTTGHKSLPVLRSYIRRGSLFTENAAAMIGL